MSDGSPRFIICGPTVYEEFRLALGHCVWSRILKQARKQLAKIGA